MKTAIVILNWNGKKLLEQFLPSIVNFSSELADIYVADNASTDNSIAYIKEFFPLVHVVENTTNGGYAKQRLCEDCSCIFFVIFFFSVKIYTNFYKHLNVL